MCFFCWSSFYWGVFFFVSFQTRKESVFALQGQCSTFTWPSLLQTAKKNKPRRSAPLQLVAPSAPKPICAYQHEKTSMKPRSLDIGYGFWAHLWPCLQLKKKKNFLDALGRSIFCSPFPRAPFNRTKKKKIRRGVDRLGAVLGAPFGYGSKLNHQELDHRF